MHEQQERIYGIGEFAKLTGVTERTLRYYDRQGLLKPSVRKASGHRFYKEQDLIRLQKIITLKYLDFPLADIADYLKQPEANLQETLLAQYELLRLKQEQLNRVLDTLDRMRKLSEGAGTIDSDLLLMYIHNVLNEQHHKEWLTRELPTSFLHDFFMEGFEPDVRLDIERRMTILLMQVKACYKQGMPADHPEPQAVGLQMAAVMEEIAGPMKARINAEELRQLEQLDSADPQALFPSGLSKEEEAYLMEVFEKLDIVRDWIGGVDLEHEQ